MAGKFTTVPERGEIRVRPVRAPVTLYCIDVYNITDRQLLYAFMIHRVSAFVFTDNEMKSWFNKEAEWAEET